MRLPIQLTLPTLNGFTYRKEDSTTLRKATGPRCIFNQKSTLDSHN